MKPLIFLAIALATASSPSFSQQKTACVGNQVWEDANGDGTRNSGERGFPNIEVRLRDGDQVLDQVISANGYFSLCAANSGTYELEIDIPENFILSPQDSGTSEHNDSDADEFGVIIVDAKKWRKQTKYDFGLIPSSVPPPKPPEPPAHFTDAVLFGPWVESRHRNDGVFGEFNAALLWARTSEILQVLQDARASNTTLMLQLGSTAEWGWNFSNGTSTFTVEKWKRSVDGFAQNPAIRSALSSAISDGVVRTIYLIDEPHHKRWSPNRSNNTHISNADLDEMARYVKSFWPGASTAVRASPRTLFSYGRENVDWRYLDEAFLMINYRKWKKNGVRRTIEGFMEREISEANRQGLGLIGSIQMLIGAPTNDKQWWPTLNSNSAKPTGKLKVSPIELEAYLNAFLQPRNSSGEIDLLNGTRSTNEVMVFRWDRNEENDWQNTYYDAKINELIEFVDVLNQ